MIRKDANLVPQIKESLRGGTGNASMKMILSAGEYPNCGMVANITLAPGCSIGEHNHVEDAELYYILSGTATANDNGNWVELSAGDAMWTANGECHSIENRSEEPLVLLAVVVK
ncbi:MAG: cupin domain-containing protein [Oscillospiraceae bacterium]|nr:cupin domain-containing protein [Oscillospiraceae bacterium]